MNGGGVGWGERGTIIEFPSLPKEREVPLGRNLPKRLLGRFLVDPGPALAGLLRCGVLLSATLVLCLKQASPTGTVAPKAAGSETHGASISRWLVFPSQNAE
jgi:hypothetical protein